MNRWPRCCARAGRAPTTRSIAVLDAALAQLPEHCRGRVLVRGDTGSGVQQFLHHISALGLQYSVGVYARQPVLDALAVLPRCAWRAALAADGDPREGVQVAELTRHLLPIWVGWPAGMRVQSEARSGVGHAHDQGRRPRGRSRRAASVLTDIDVKFN